MTSAKPSPAQPVDFRRNSPARTVIRLTLAMVILGLTWRIVRYAVHFPLWGDEAFIVASLYHRGFADMFKPLEHAQIAPLGFLWAELAISRLLGLSVFALRLPAFLCGLFSMLLFWRFARRSLDKRSVLLAIAIFAASSYIVRHSTEVKPYAGDLAISLALLYLGWDLYRRSDSSLRWLALIVGAAVAVWLSFPAVFIAAAVAMLLAVRCRQERSAKLLYWLLSYALVLGLSFLTMYLVFGKMQRPSTEQMLAIPTWKEAFPPLTQPWLLPWWLLKIHAGNMLAYPIGGKNFASALTFLLVVTGIVSLWRSRRRDLLVLLLGPLPLMLIAAALKKYPYGTSVRISMHMAPAFCLLAGVGLSSTLRSWLSRRRAMVGFYIATGIMAVITIGGSVYNIAIPQKEYSDRNNLDALRIIADWTGPQDQWVIFNSLEEVSCSLRLSRFSGHGARFRYYVRWFGPDNIRWAPPAEQVPARTGGKTWLLVYRDVKTPFPPELIQRYLDQLRLRLGPAQKKQPFVLSSPKDSPRSKIEAIEVYEFPALPPHPKAR